MGRCVQHGDVEQERHGDARLLAYDRDSTDGVTTPARIERQGVNCTSCFMGSVKAAQCGRSGLSRTVGVAATLIVMVLGSSMPGFGEGMATMGAATVAQEAGAPVLTVRDGPRASSAPARVPDPLPTELVTPNGVLFSVVAEAHGLPAIRSLSIGEAGIARLRALARIAGVDEHATAPVASAGAPVDIGYRHPSGRLVSTRVPTTDVHVSALLEALRTPVLLGAPGPARPFEPTVFRLVSRPGTPVKGAAIATWNLRSTTLESTARCVAVRGSDGQRLRRELTRIAGLDPSALASDRGVVSVWMRAGGPPVQLSVRVVLPGEPDCVALAR